MAGDPVPTPYPFPPPRGTAPPFSPLAAPGLTRSLAQRSDGGGGGGSKGRMSQGEGAGESPAGGAAGHKGSGGGSDNPGQNNIRISGMPYVIALI